MPEQRDALDSRWYLGGGHRSWGESGRPRESFLEEMIPEIYLKLSELKDDSRSSEKEVERKRNRRNCMSKGTEIKLLIYKK